MEDLVSTLGVLPLKYFIGIDMSICLLTLNVEKEALPLGNDYWMCSYQSYDKSTSSFITEPPRNS